MHCQSQALFRKPFQLTLKSCRFAARLRNALKTHSGDWQTRWTSNHYKAPGASDSASNLLTHIHSYGLDLPPQTHVVIRLIQAGQFGIVRYSFRPFQPQTTGIILLLHGYILHSLCQAAFISHLVSKGYEVVAFDWPGHGLSSGKRACISDFRVYALVLSSLIDSIERTQDTPIHLVAHSTGCSAWIARTINGFPDPFDKVILISPLVRSAAWIASVTGACIAKRIGLPLVPRVFRNSSHDMDYLNRLKYDPLAPWVLPIQWTHTLIRWQRTLAHHSPHAKAINVFQGTRDTVVDWKHGLRMIHHLFPQASIRRWKGQRHDLLNEGKIVRSLVFDAIDRIFEP